jgi:hypothetical protein
VERHEYRTARWVTVAGIAGGAASLLLGAVQVSAYFQHYQGANLWELADGIACVLLGAAPIVEAPRARVLVVTDHGLSGFRNLHPMVITWPTVNSFEAGFTSGRSVVAAVWVTLASGKQFPLTGTRGSRRHARRIAASLAEDLRQYHAVRGTHPPGLPKPPPAPPLPPPVPPLGSIGKTLW